MTLAVTMHCEYFVSAMRARSLLRTAVVFPITLYQRLISPLKPSSCIYFPTCSSYTKESVLTHGILKGLLLGLFRLFRCVGGLYTGGHDPVPEQVTVRYLFGSYRTFFRFRHRGTT